MCEALFVPPEGTGSRQVQFVSGRNINEVQRAGAAVDMWWNSNETH